MSCPDRIDGGYAWRVGDLAERSGGQDLLSDGTAAVLPRHGEALIVTAVREIASPCGCTVVTLCFARCGAAKFVADRFHRITPRAEQLTPADAIFCARYLRTAPRDQSGDA